MHPGATPLWLRLEASPDPAVRAAALALQDELRHPPARAAAARQAVAP